MMLEDPASKAAPYEPDTLGAAENDQRAVPAAVDHPIGRPVDDDIVDQWGKQSFPASDPPANW